MYNKYDMEKFFLRLIISQLGGVAFTYFWATPKKRYVSGI
jgi:hypothetical protein